MNPKFSKDELATASIEALNRVADLVAPLSPAQWRAPTCCPGWQVFDVVAHLVDFDSFLSGNPRSTAEPDWATLPHVVNDTDRFIELGVHARRGNSPAELLTELRAVIELRRAFLAAQSDDLATEVTGPFGTPITLERALTMRVFDTWVHEQDIRDAEGTPGGWSGMPHEVALSVLITALPVVWGKKCKPPLDAVLQIVISDQGKEIFIRLDQDGQARFGDPAEPTVRLELTEATLVHRMCGRVGATDQSFVEQISITGPTDLCERLLDQMVVTV